ncbi:monocarboxylate transporter 9-like isoform X2 [Lineus longissimus]
MTDNSCAESDDEDDQVEMEEPSIEIPYGWVVAASSFILQMLVVGCTTGYGVIYVEFLEYFQQSRSKTSGIAALCQLFLSFGGIVCSWATPRFGHRKTLMVGVLLSTVAMISSGFAPNVFYLYATYGIIGGFGFGLCYVGSLSIVALYFDKRLSLASGLAMAGGGFSYFIFPPTIKAAIEAYTVRGAMVILSCLWLQGCVCAALMRPPPPRKVRIGKKDPEDMELMKGGEPDPLMKKRSYENIVEHLDKGKDFQSKEESQTSLTLDSGFKPAVSGFTGKEEEDTPRTKSRRYRISFKGCLKGNIILEWKFWFFALATVLYRIDFTTFPHIAPDFALVTGHSKLQAHILMNILGACLIPARIIGGHILDRPLTNVFVMMIGNLLLFGTISLGYPFTRDVFWLMAVLTGCRGAVQGIIAIFPVPIGVELFGVERITHALAYFNLFKGIGDLITAPLGASIYDHTGDYLLVYVTCACMSVIAAGLTLYLYLHSKGIFNKFRQQKRRETY